MQHPRRAPYCPGSGCEAQRVDRGQVRVDQPPGFPAAIVGDATRLRQILINLLGNAVKFTPAGGTVTLRARTGDNGDMVVVVSDTGIGMNRFDVEKALTPFGQAVGDQVGKGQWCTMLRW